jgi:hypothetical protein
MKLTVPQCLDYIKSPKNTSYIAAARRQEQRLVMHVEPIQSKEFCNEAYNDFLSWVQSILPEGKYKRFEQLVKFPLETVDLTESIFDELSKVHDTPDSHIDFEFRAPALKEDFLAYLANSMNDENFWKEQGFQALKTGINSFLVVDLPTKQMSNRPDPYYYILSIFSVHDVNINLVNGAVEYIIFFQADGSLLVIDDVAYRRFEKPDTGEWRLTNEWIHSTYTMQTETNQFGNLIEGLGYAPVCSLYEQVIKGTRGINKRGPLTNALGKLDKLLFKIVSQDYFEMYGSYPITVAYKSKCKYRDEHGNECNAGYVNYSYLDHTTMIDGEPKVCYAQKVCPTCSKDGLMGPGTIWRVDPPTEKTDADLMQNPAKFIEPSTDLLEFGVEKIETMKREIFVNSVGFDNIPTKEAINEKQQDAQFEGRKAILNRIREQLDATRKFCLETAAKLRYGPYFISSTVFGGEEYFLRTPADIMDQYQNAKKAGMPSYVISRIRESYSKTKYKSNPAEQQRQFILSELEPYPDYTVQELKNLGIDQKDPNNFMLKVDFITFISRFEREQANVVEFGSAIAMQKKIDTIKKKLLEYAAERVKAAPPLPAPIVPGAA